MPKPEPSVQEQADRDAAAEADRALYEASGDAWHVLTALGRYRADEPLPLWIRRWLLRVTGDLLRLQFSRADPQDCTEAIPRVLQLVGSVSRARWRREASFLTTIHEMAKKRDGSGRPLRGEAERIAKILVEACGLESPSSLYRIKRRVREMRRPRKVTLKTESPVSDD